MNGPDIADILDHAADLIEPEGAWTQGFYARGASGLPVKVNGKAAVCFCGIGAVLRAARARTVFDLSFGRAALAKALGVGWLSDFYHWQDAPKRTQAEVVAALRQAALKARGQS